MSYFKDAKHLTINGGDFSNVNGNQNHLNYGNGPFQIDGKDNSMTIVEGPYYNTPNNSIRNEAGGDIEIYGIGDRSEVTVETMEPLSRSHAAPTRAQTAIGRDGEPNSKITNRAGGNIRVMGQGDDTRVRIGSPSQQHEIPQSNVMYSPIQEYSSMHGYPPQQPYPYQYQNHVLPPSFQGMAGNPGIPLPPMAQFNWSSYPSYSSHNNPYQSASPFHPNSVYQQSTNQMSAGYLKVAPQTPTPFQSLASPQFPPTGHLSDSITTGRTHVVYAVPYAAPLPVHASENFQPVMPARSASATPAPAYVTALTESTSPSQTVATAHISAVVSPLLNEWPSNGMPQLLGVQDVPYLAYPQEDAQIQAVTPLSSHSGLLTGAMNLELAAPPVMAPFFASAHPETHRLSAQPLQMSENVSSIGVSTSTIVNMVPEEANKLVKIGKCCRFVLWLIKSFKKVKNEN